MNTQKIEEKNIGLSNIPKNIVKVAKNLLGVLLQDKSFVKKKQFKNDKYFRKCTSCNNTPKY